VLANEPTKKLWAHKNDVQSTVPVCASTQALLCKQQQQMKELIADLQFSGTAVEALQNYGSIDRIAELLRISIDNLTTS